MTSSNQSGWRTPWAQALPCANKLDALKYHVRINQLVLGEDTPPERELRYIDISSVDALGRIASTEEMTFEKAPSRARRLPRHGDTIVSTVRTYLKAIAYVDNPHPSTVCSTGFAVLSPRPTINGSYLSWWMRSEPIVDEICARSVGVSYPAINALELGNLPIPVLDLNRQKAIAEFLDRKTATLDSLIQKKEHLIELLQEKRQALITQAVTKGLDPKVEMKESGEEFIGLIPAHWRVLRISKVATKLCNGFVGPTRDILVDDGIPYLQSLHIKGGEIRFDKPYFVAPAWLARHERVRLRKDDVLIVQTGDIGQVAAVSDGWGGAGCHALIIFRPNPEFGLGGYFSTFLRSSVGFNLLLREQTGALHPHLEVGKVRDIPLLLPPVDEQRRIAEQVAVVEASIRAQENLLGKQLSLLREYRQSLISAAVTGQLAVPDEPSP